MLKLVTGPTVEPVSLTEAKLHLRVDGTDDDTVISALIVAAREAVEHIARRALISQTWELILDSWPDSPFEVPLPPLSSVTSIKYKDEDGVEATFSSSSYVVDADSQPGRVALASEASWPGGTLYPVGGVRVRFVAGYGSAATAVPQRYKQAILLLVGHWYEHREEASEGRGLTQVPFGVEALLWMDRAF